MEFSQKLKEKRTTLSSSNPTAEYICRGEEISISRINLHAHIHSTIRNSQDTEAIKMSLNRRIDKENVAYTFNCILFSLKGKKRKLLYTTWMKPGDIVVTEISRPQKDKYCKFPLL